MELVIKLSDKEYSELQSASYYSFDKYTAYLAMKNGTPLPKHHGRLIDADELEECKEMMNDIMDESKYAITMDDVRNVLTIIEAEGSDKE